MMKRLLFLSLYAATLTVALPARAEDDGDELKLDDLLNADVVSATKNAQSLKEAPAIMEVISDRDMREKGYTSVAEALRTVPGFSVLFDYTNFNVGVRGINSGMRAWSRIIKVMIDGQTVALRTDSTNFLGPELIPLEAIKRIEIIRGPASALYGADAYLGVINIVTKTGEDMDGGVLKAHADSFAKGGYAGEFAYGAVGDMLEQPIDLVLAGAAGRADRSGLGVAATSPNSTIFKDKLTTNDVTQPQAAFGSVTLGYEEELGKLRLTGNLQRMNSLGKFLDWSIGQKSLDSNNRMVVDNAFVRATYDKALLDNVDSSFGVSYVSGGPTPDDRLDIGKPYMSKIRQAGYKGWDFNGEVRYQMAESNVLTVGADYQTTDQRIQSIYDLYTQDFGVAKAGSQVLSGQDLGTKTLTNAGAFVQDMLHPIDGLGITLGVRGDRHNVYGDALNYRAGAVYQWSDTLTSKLLYGTSFKAPSPIQLYSAPILIGDLVGNEQLKPETAQTMETEVLWEVTDDLVLTTNAYATKVNNLVQIVQEVSNYQPQNVGEATTLGAEATARWQLGPVRGYLNGTLQRTDVVGQASSETAGDTGSELFPSMMANAGATAPLPWVPVDLNLEFRFVGDMKPSGANLIRSSEPYRIPASKFLDLKLMSRKLRIFDQPCEVSFKVANMLDEQAEFPGFGGIDIPAPGRSFVLNVAQRF